VRTEHQVSAGGVLVRPAGERHEVLLAARRIRSGQLVWGLPKGLVEPEETHEDAAAREVLEETGWRGRIRDPLGEIEYWFAWEGVRIHKTVHFFLMDAVEETAGRDREMEEVRWFPLDEAEETVGFDSEREVVGRARASLAG
jgi:8-oxo-dGTP pyrophosphatase MutT (NUDIX family)